MQLLIKRILTKAKFQNITVKSMWKPTENTITKTPITRKYQTTIIRYEDMRTQIFPGMSLQYFIKWKNRRKSNTLNSTTHGHSTQVINIHEKI